MEQQYELILNSAIELFENGNYDEAVASLVQIYNTGCYTEQIKEFLYANFIFPNEEEYRRIYSDSLDYVNFFSYDDLAIDFIAVSEKKYYLFDKIQNSFLGVFDFETLTEKRDADCDMKKDIRAVLVSNVWDIRIVVENIYSSIWDTIYMICDEERNYLLSFLKIPEVKSLFFDNVVFFENESVLCEYFRRNEAKYLPRIMLGNDEEKYKPIIEQLHRERIEKNERNRDGILVSFCIPSYNRGDIAYKNVMQYLQSEYDSEIEVVLSNNDSAENTEGYDQIEKMQDSRLVYNKMSENKGFTGNILKVISMAKGKFIVLSSDEDFFDIAKMTSFLNFVRKHKEAAVIGTTGIGVNFLPQKYEIVDTIQDRLLESINLNYITGLCYNNELLKRYSVIQNVEKYINNFFYVTYPHICIAFLVCQYSSFVKLPLSLWICNETEYSNSNETLYNAYCNLDSRILQQNEAVSFIVDAIIKSNQEALLQLFKDRIAKSYHLLTIANSIMGELFKREYSWTEICLKLHENNLDTIEKFNDLFSAEELEWIKYFCDELFIRYLQENPQQSVESELERKAFWEQVEQIGEYYKKNNTFKGYILY